MMQNYYGNMYGWGFGGGLMMVLFIAACVLVIAWFVREVGSKKADNKTNDSKSSRDTH